MQQTRNCLQMRKRSKIRELTLGCQSLHTRAVCHSTKYRCCFCSQYLLRVSLIYHHFIVVLVTECLEGFLSFSFFCSFYLLVAVEWTWKNLEAKGGVVDKKGDCMFCWYWGFTHCDPEKVSTLVRAPYWHCVFDIISVSNSSLSYLGHS